MKNRFNFKQFTINQDRCAMKIGTDSVLLGAWTSLDSNPYSILDIGAGTGILALMIAQRSGQVAMSAEIIDAIEIDDDAFEQCVENFEASPWGDRLFCYHASLEEFVEDHSNDESESEKYDLIISNPPFYLNTYKSNNEQRDLARFVDAMPFRQLIESVSKLLSPHGSFSVVIPFFLFDHCQRCQFVSTTGQHLSVHYEPSLLLASPFESFTCFTRSNPFI